MKRKLVSGLSAFDENDIKAIKLLPRISIYKNSMILDDIECTDYTIQIDWLFWSIYISNTFDLTKILKV